MKIRISVITKIMLLTGSVLIVSFAANQIMKWSDSQRTKQESAQAFQKLTKTALQGVLMDKKAVLEKGAQNTLFLDELTTFCEDQNKNARMVLEGHHISLESSGIKRFSVYDKSKKLILSMPKESENVSPPDPKLPVYLDTLLLSCATNYSTEFYFRNGGGLAPVEYCAIVAVLNWDDELVGYVELAVDTLSCLQRIAEVTDYSVACFDHKDNQFYGIAKQTVFTNKTLANTAKSIKDKTQILPAGNNQYVYANVTPIEAPDKTPLASLWVVREYTTQFEAHQRNTVISLSIFIAVLLISLLIVYLYSKKGIVTPLQQAVALANKIGAGDLTGEMKTKSSDETGILGNALNRMVQTQRERANELTTIANGDLSQNISLLSQNDTVGHAMHTLKEKMNILLLSLKQLSEQQIAGQISARCKLDGLAGIYKELAENLNSAFDGVTHPILEGVEIIKAYAAGDLSTEMHELPGEQMLLTKGLRTIRNNLLAVLAATEEMYQKQQQGDIDFYINEAGFEGAYKELSKGFNESVKLHVTHQMQMLDLLEEYADGNLANKMENLPGKQIIITQKMNLLRQNVLNLIEAVQMLAQSGIEGELDVRADAQQHHGDFRKIVEGINSILNAVVTPLNETSQVLQAAANNDLTIKVQGEYQGRLADLKENVNITINKLSNALGQVKDVVDLVHSGSNQISDASQSLSQGATEQASSLEQITSSMAEIASQTKTNAENANQAHDLSDKARKAAETGTSQMAQMVESMESINTASQQIAKIIKVIDDIAFQTNLLALNAAVEAARAGRHGKGFAVVADEVRNLAGRSAKAAKETSELIDSSTAKVAAGMEIATVTSTSFQEIVDEIIKTTNLVGEIASASNEQAQGVSEVNIGLNQVDNVTQQNTANAEETASAATQLNHHAGELQNLIAKFKLTSRQAALSDHNSTEADTDSSLPLLDTP